MTEYDMGQAALVQLIRASHNLFDMAAIGALREVGRNMAASSKLDLAELEGAVEEIRSGIMGLPDCPFAETISTYKDCCGGLPEEIALLADFANNQGGAWVSAFCGIHQSLRKARIGDSYQQIGCRSGKKISFANQDIMSEDEAKEALQTYACVYSR